jgi:hypothetical protein
MTTSAFIGPDPTVRDVALLAGLIVAAVLLAVFVFGHVRSGTSKRRGMLLSALSLIGLASIVWSASQPVSVANC